MGADGLLEGLNEAQRRAVTHDAGPQIVLAGPGTGKTRVIVHRVAYLVRARGVAPESIVAVTFTNKAAGELRERLASLLGPGVADRVNAYTFHGLGYRFLSRFPDVSGLGTNIELMDGAQRRRVLRELVRSGQVSPGCASEGIDALVDEAGRVIEVFRQNAIAPADAAAFAEEWADRLGRGLSSGGTATDETGLEAQRACATYGLFEEECRRRGWVSMDELLTRPAQLIRSSPLVRSVCRSDYRHVVVDEFQDVNLAQIEMLRAIAPPESRPDLTVVGDDDQAIYEFRGADDRAFVRFDRIWPGAARVELTESYRSAQAVLAAANEVISRATERFKPGKALHAALSHASGSVEIVQLESDDATGGVIARLVQQEVESGAAPHSIAVIARQHGHLDDVEAALELQGVPCSRRERRGAAEDEGVRDVMAWAALLADPSTPWKARRVLSRPPVGVPLETISTWDAGFGASGREGSFVAYLRERGGEQARAFLERFDRLASMGAARPASEALLRIIEDCGVVYADGLAGREHASRVAHLVAMVRFARVIQRRLDPPGDLRAFLAYYDDLDERERDFGLVGAGRVQGDDDDDEEGEGVRLVTAHSAKGLEFDSVFLVRVQPGYGFPCTSSPGGDRPALPEGQVDRMGDTRGPKERRLAEERRLFYVACTRARRRLVMLSKHQKSKSSSVHFAQELMLESPSLVRVVGQSSLLGGGEGGALAALATPGSARGRVYRASEEERRAARRAVSAALDGIERADASREDIERAGREFRVAAERLAVASHFERTGREPAWVERDAGGAARAAADRLRDARQEDEAMARSASFRPPRAPLELSYTLVRDYQTCPRCCYLKHVLGLGEAPNPAMSLGTLVHGSLERHARAWRDAESRGGKRPGFEDLLACARDIAAGGGETWWPEVEALLGAAHTLMERCNAEVLEIERTWSIPYVVDGVEHRLKAKVDRVDRITPGVRVVDYKTGDASKAKRGPGKRDLQLGVYALVVGQVFPGAEGEAEYWLLRTGEVGSIPWSGLDLAGVRGEIDSVVRAILAGRFERGKDCRGTCAMLGDR